MKVLLTIRIKRRKSVQIIFKKTKNRGKKLVNGTENESPGIKSREDLRGNEIG